MNLTPAIVFDALQDYSPVSHISGEKKFAFSHILLLSADLGAMKEDVLYLGNCEQLLALGEQVLGGICAIALRDGESYARLRERQGASFIYIPGEPDILSLANRLYTTFTQVKEWSNTINNSIIQGKSLEEISVIAGPMFHDNALIIANGSYDVLGSNLKRVPENDRLDDILSKRYYSKKVSDILAEMDYPTHSIQRQKPVLINPPTYSGCPLFLVTYHSNNRKLIAFMSVHYLRGMPTEGQYDLFCHLTELLRPCFEQTESDVHTPGPVTFLLQSLIEHTRDNEAYLIDRAKALGLSLDGNYRLGVIRWEDFSLSTAYYLLGRLKTILASSYFRIFLYRESILVIMNWGSDNLRELENVTQLFGEMAEVIRACSGRAGFSSIFESLVKLNVAYKQAFTAVDYGKKFSPKDCIHVYSNYYIYDVLDTYAEKYPLEDMYCQRLKRLKDDTEEGDSINLRLLRAYLSSNCSIAAAAKEMHMHRNSIIYRLEKIQDLLGLNMDDPDVQLRLRLSFKTFDMMENRRFTVFPQRESYESLLKSE